MSQTWIFSHDVDYLGCADAHYLDVDEVCVFPIAEHLFSVRWRDQLNMCVATQQLSRG